MFPVFQYDALCCNVFVAGTVVLSTFTCNQFRELCNLNIFNSRFGVSCVWKDVYWETTTISI